jgi:tight adherence protein C
MIFPLLGAAASFVFVSTLLVIASGTLRNPVEARLGRLAPTSARSMADKPFSDRVFLPVVDNAARFFVGLLPTRFVERTNRQLLAAGSPITSQAFFTIVLVTGVLLPAAATFFIAQTGRNLSALTVLFLIWFLLAGLLLPFFWLRRRIRLRKAAVLKKLPDAFDLITVSVEAGLGLDAALRQVATKLPGPLSDELNLTLRQVGMGRARREALEDMAHRLDVPEVTTFANAVIQAEQLGTSLGRVLRSQTISLRVHRRQKAEENARRAPVKMVFPLVLFIMPAFFIVTVGPVVVHLVTYLNGK